MSIKTFKTNLSALIEIRGGAGKVNVPADDDPRVEYADEVLQERAVIDDLLFYQQCRVALERCLANKGSGLRYKRQDGTVRTVSFRRLSLGRVEIRELA